jgi:hypothetical protein
MSTITIFKNGVQVLLPYNEETMDFAKSMLNVEMVPESDKIVMEPIVVRGENQPIANRIQVVPKPVYDETDGLEKTKAILDGVFDTIRKFK